MVAVVTVASGGLAVVDTTAGGPMGVPVEEATNGYGIAVTKVGNGLGMPVSYRGLVVPAGPPLIWNANDRSGNVILSVANTRVTFSTAAAGGVRTFPANAAGKVYAEFLLGTAPGTMCFGFADAGFPLDLIFANGVAAVLYRSDTAGLYVGGSFLGAVAAAVSGQTVRYAIDFGAQLFWMCLSNGSWNGDPGADPTTGNGGFDFGVLGLTSLLFYIGAATSVTSATAFFTSAAFTFPVPSGYGPPVMS